jgi:hypothetical protein
MMNSRTNALPPYTHNRLTSRGPHAPDFLLLRRATGLLLFLIVCGGILPAYAAPISLTAMDTTYTQNFDTLSNTAGSTTNTLALEGWFLTESGGGARDNETYAVDTGGSNTGDTYSYGTPGSTERALGMLRSGTLIPVVGASFTNNTGVTINSLDIAYTGEEWRLGTAGRTDQISFEYSLNATDLVTGTWTGVSSLNFVTPDTAAIIGAKNGNAAASRTQLSTTISGLSIPNGATFWIRWTDLDASGADDGLAIDDFSLTPHSTPELTINDVSLNEGDSGMSSFTFTVGLSTPAGAGGVTFDIATADNSATAPSDFTATSLTGQTIPAGSSTYTFTVLVNGDTTPEANETFFVNITNVTGATVIDGQGQGTIVNDDIQVAATLTIDFAGSGSGTVTSTLPDSRINCIKGSSDGCSADYPVGTSVTLAATGDWKSTFKDWSGGVASSATPVTFTMDAGKTVTATFNPNYKAKLIPGGALFASIQEAYAGVPSGSLAIQAQAWSFLEDLLFANGTAVTLTGGMDSSYNPTTGYSTVNSLTVGTGSAVIGNITIK